MSFKKVLTNLHLVEDESPIVSATPAPAVVSVPIAQTAPSYTNWQQPASLPPADPEMVSKIKASVFGASPIVSQFLKSLELVRPQFPNDESACMRATLAFTQFKKDELIGELNRTVNAAFLHTKSSLDTEHAKAREQAVGGFEQQLSDINRDLHSIQEQISQLQATITAKSTTATDLQSKIRDAEASLQQQDAVVKGSLAQVEQNINALAQTFSKL